MVKKATLSEGRGMSESDRNDLLERIAELEAMVAGGRVVEDEVNPNEYIYVMSMLTCALNISNLTGKTYKFEKQFDKKRILYKDVVEIIEKHPTFAEAGFFIILDPRVVRIHGLDGAYENVLKEDTMKAVLSEKFEVSYPIFANINKRLKEIVARNLVNAIVAGENVDMNLVFAVSRDTGIDIVEKAEDTKNLSNVAK